MAMGLCEGPLDYGAVDCQPHRMPAIVGLCAQGAQRHPQLAVTRQQVHGACQLETVDTVVPRLRRGVGGSCISRTLSCVGPSTCAT